MVGRDLLCFEMGNALRRLNLCSGLHVVLGRCLVFFDGYVKRHGSLLVLVVGGQTAVVTSNLGCLVLDLLLQVVLTSFLEALAKMVLLAIHLYCNS